MVSGPSSMVRPPIPHWMCVPASQLSSMSHSALDIPMIPHSAFGYPLGVPHLGVDSAFAMSYAPSAMSHAAR